MIIGSDVVWAIENFYVEYIKQMGVDTHLFEEHSKFLRFYEKSLINKILFRAGLSPFVKNLQKELIKYTNRLNPDVILVFKGMEVLPETLKYFKSKKIFLVNYNADNPFIFSGLGSGNKNITESIGLYDLHLTYNEEVRSRLIKQFNIPTEILPFGFDISDSDYLLCKNEPEILKTCFVGNPDKTRVEFLKKVSKEIPIDIYGNNWEKYIANKNVNIYPAVYGYDCWKVLRQYRVQLNLMRIHNLNSHNMRTFEIPGVGGIMLAPATVEHALYFDENVNAFFFDNDATCIERAWKILSLTQNEANIIRENARRQSIEKRYTYKDRAKQLVDLINSVLPKKL